ncbi:MAG: DUF1517 domain-containing protein [Polyangiales bacterium]|nr:DUF1517 domain-containing protein [Myxococcales bacterium]
MGRALLVVTLFTSPVAAQHTGGSFGSSSWGSTSSSSSSSSSYGGSSSWSSSSSSSSSSGSSWSSSSSSPSSSSGYSGASLFPDVDFEISAADKFLFLFVVIVVLFFVVVGKERGWWPFSSDGSFSPRAYDEPSRALATHGALTARRSSGGDPPRATPPSPAGHAAFGDVLVMQVSVGMAASVRRRIQHALTTMAQSASFDGAEGRARILREVLTLLDEDGAARVYAGVGIEGHHAPMLAQRSFTRLVADLRSRYRHELFRNDDGVRSERGAPVLRARADEGEGLVVVSLVIAVEGVFAPAPRYDTAVAALRGLPPSSIVALEVIWSPAAEDDRMSSLELETLYPELRRASEGVGRVRCTCGTAYAAELPRCPACGRPKEASAPS